MEEFLNIPAIKLVLHMELDTVILNVHVILNSLTAKYAIPAEW
jgi:hypothetical protein